MPPLLGDEAEVATGFLEFHRATFAAKCADLPAAELARRTVPPSGLSLLGLIRHLADTERAWFDRIAGRPRRFFYETDDDEDVAFANLTGSAAELDAAWADWHTAVDEARAVLAGADFDDVVDHPRWGPMTVRWIVVHMVEEYARHNGHADLLREATDGATGV
jgi:uncharacterized damage-inducible protein DinB